MAHIWMSHGTHMIESWHTYKCVMAHVWMSHGTHMNGSWHTYEWVTAHIWLSHGTHMNGSWHTYERVTALMWLSHHAYICTYVHLYVTHVQAYVAFPEVMASDARGAVAVIHMNESRHIYDWFTAHIWLSHHAYICIYTYVLICDACTGVWSIFWSHGNWCARSHCYSQSCAWGTISSGACTCIYMYIDI